MAVGQRNFPEEHPYMETVLNGRSDVLTGRELSTLIWGVIIGVYLLRQPGVRSALRGFVRTLLQWKILANLTGLLLYVLGTIWALQKIGFWDISLLKETIIWFLFTAPALTFGPVGNIEAQRGLFGFVAKRTIGIGVVLQFLVSRYTYSTVAEFLILPIGILAAMIGVVAERDQRTRDVAKLASGIQVIIGLLYVWKAVSELFGDLNGPASLEAMRNFAVAPLLSLSLLPFIYAMLLAMAYETLFLRLSFRNHHTASFLRSAKLRIFAHVRFSLRRALKVLRERSIGFTQTTTIKDFEAVLHLKSDRVMGELCE